MAAGPDVALVRVFVVDDERSNLDLLRALLGRAGYQNVSLFADPLEAVRRFDSEAPDIVLLDLHMPGLDGFELLEELRTHIDDDDFVPFVMLTADQSRSTRERAL